MVIYVDILLFVNAIVNYAILLTSQKLLKRDSRLYRLLLGSVTGALFSLLIFSDVIENMILLFLLRILSTAAITIVTFGWKSRREYLKMLLCCITVSVVYSGFFILFYQLFKPPQMVIVNDIVYLQVNPLWLTALTAVIYLIILLIYKLFSERIKNTVVSLQFTIKDTPYSCIAKIDTGCNLKEPFSSAPVIIADNAVFTVDTNLPYRIVPYNVLNGGSYLNAVKADRVLIDKQAIDREIYIASADIPNADYQAIINSDITR